MIVSNADSLLPSIETVKLSLHEKDDGIQKNASGCEAITSIRAIS